MPTQGGERDQTAKPILKGQGPFSEVHQTSEGGRLGVIELMGMSLPLAEIASVYLLFRVKHFMADYLLQTSWMARGKQQAVGWAAALFAHTGMHALGTMAIALVFAPSLWWLGAVDFFVHAAIDKSKGLWGVHQPSEPVFWWVHGIDQEAHNLTHFAFVIAIVLA